VSSKYIILQTPEGEKAVIFPGDSYYHDQIAAHFEGCEVISAGFVSIKPDGTIECYGKSTGLKIASRGKDDAVLIQNQLRRA